MTDQKSNTGISWPKTVKPQQVGLEIPPDLTNGDVHNWKTVLGQLVIRQGVTMWWIGDWLNYGEKKWGEQYKDAIEATDYNYGTLANAKYVASRIEFSRRRENLTFGHHTCVARFSPDDQDRWLDRAIEEKWTVKALREEVSKEKGSKSASSPKHRVGADQQRGAVLLSLEERVERVREAFELAFGGVSAQDRRDLLAQVETLLKGYQKRDIAA